MRVGFVENPEAETRMGESARSGAMQVLYAGLSRDYIMKLLKQLILLGNEPKISQVANPFLGSGDQQNESFHTCLST
jgi:hypothetical protein